MRVDGGVYSGVYSLSDDNFVFDREVYSTKTDDGNFDFLAFLYVDVRRRLEDARHHLEGMESTKLKPKEYCGGNGGSGLSAHAHYTDRGLSRAL